MTRSRSVETSLNGDATASEAILHAVAAVERTDPTELTPPLYSAIDPEALDAFVESLAGRPGWIGFSYRGHEVAVDGIGCVRVRSKESERNGRI